jgi:hypothetical protein
MIKPLEVVVDTFVTLFVIAFVAFVLGTGGYLFKTIYELITGEECE